MSKLIVIFVFFMSFSSSASDWAKNWVGDVAISDSGIKHVIKVKATEDRFYNPNCLDTQEHHQLQILSLEGAASPFKLVFKWCRNYSRNMLSVPVTTSCQGRVESKKSGTYYLSGYQGFNESFCPHNKTTINLRNHNNGISINGEFQGKSYKGKLNWVEQ